MVSSDRKVFEEGSAVRARLLEYGRLADELHVVVSAKRGLGLRNEKIEPNIFLYPTNSRSRLGYIRGVLRCARTLKARGIDIVTTQDPFEAGLAGFFAARILGAKLHLQIHTDFMSPYFARESFMNRIRVRIAKFLLPRANAVRVVSLRIKRSLNMFVKKEITVLPIFIDAEKIARTSVAYDLKKKYPQFNKILLVASRLSPEKNVDMAIEAMQTVVQKYPATGLIVVGSGPESDRLKILSRARHLEANIVFEGWRDGLISYYKTADFFLLPSNYEGYGMTVVEALSAGCPVVMTDVGCAGEVVHNGENGLVVPVGDRTAFTNAVLTVLSGETKLTVKIPELPTKEEYLALYKRSWEDALA